MKPIGFSTPRAFFHAHAYPGSTALSFFFKEGSAVYTVGEFSGFFSTFWTFNHLDAPVKPS